MASGPDDSFTSLQTVTRFTASSSSNDSQSKVTKQNESAIIHAVQDTEGFFDILSAVYKLKYRQDFKDIYPRLLRRVSVVNLSTKETILCFMFYLLTFISFTKLTGVLYEVGFNILADRITSREIRPAKLKNSTGLQGFFYRLKSSLDDNIFNHRRRYLKLLFIDLTSKLDNSESGHTEWNVGKLAIVTWLWVQQCETSEDIKQIISDMVNKLPQSVNKTLPNLVRLSKLAVACELDGDSDASDRFLSEALSLAKLYTDPLIMSLSIHDRRYVLQLRLMKSKDEEVRCQIQTECIMAIHFFSAFQNELCIYMRRILCLYLVHNFLKIGQNFEIDMSEEASPDEMEQATNLLSSLERCFQSGIPLEQRRKMIYFILMARMHEIGGEHDVAVSYLSKADNLREDGTFFRVEEDHLTHFKSRLANQ